MLKKSFIAGLVIAMPSMGFASGSEIALSYHSDSADASDNWTKVDVSNVTDLYDNISLQVDLTYLSDDSDQNYGAMAHLLYDVSDNLTVGVTFGASNENGNGFEHLGIEAKYEVDNWEFEFAHSSEDGSYWDQISTRYQITSKIGLELDVLSWGDSIRTTGSVHYEIANVIDGSVSLTQYDEDSFIGVSLSKNFGDGKVMNHRDYLTNWW